MCVCACVCACVCVCVWERDGESDRERESKRKRERVTHSIYIHVSRMGCYGVATISRLLKIVGLFCRILSLLQESFAKETYVFKKPTNCSHPMMAL